MHAGRRLVSPFLFVIVFVAFVPLAASVAAESGGELVATGLALSCPLQQTEVKAEITGHIARVEVTQTFRNVAEQAIEAVYFFPLPNHAAVDDMEIRVGSLSVIRGVIKKKEEARAAYEAGRKAGHVAALLDQERPNVFRQAVANIPPGLDVTVRIRYVETLPYLEGAYAFTFPMVVAPRYAGIDRTAEGLAESGAIVPQGMRAGHDISLEIHLDAGAAVRDLRSPTHQVDVESDRRGGDIIRLSRLDNVPNRDFVLRYSIDAAAPRLVVLTHRGEKEGSFLALLQPGLEPAPDALLPKELIFVVDDSGSMGGAPIEQVRKAMLYALRNLGPLDTFQIVSFASSIRVFSDAPVPATSGNIARAAVFVNELRGSGGTILIDGVRQALAYPEDPGRMRIISFMTDGLIGNEAEILASLEKHLGNARLFPMGVGSAPNRYLLDEMADFGRGVVEYVLPADETNAAVDHFYERMRSPFLTDVAIDWGGLAVSDVYPSRIPDLFAGQPVALYGRYDGEGSAEVRLTGRLAGHPFERTFHVVLPPRDEDGEAIETLWARARIAELSRENGGQPGPEGIAEIVRLGLENRLVTDYTSFVAVEERVTTGDGNPTTVDVPSPCPAGMSCAQHGARDANLMLAVRVSAGDVVDTESTTTSTTISADFIDALPILGRNYQDVLTLAGNGVTVKAVNGATQSGSSAEFNRAQGGFVKVDTRSKKPESISVDIDLARRSYRLGETIEVTLTIENHGSALVVLPADLSVAAGTARFAIEAEGGIVPREAALSTSAGENQSIAPGQRLVIRILLNGPGGYRMDSPGHYRIRLLGAPFWLPDSNVLSFSVRS
jgi:Ca-activated chloride channel family protein